MTQAPVRIGRFVTGRRPPRQFHESTRRWDVRNCRPATIRPLPGRRPTRRPSEWSEFGGTRSTRCNRSDSPDRRIGYASSVSDRPISPSICALLPSTSSAR